MKRLTPLRSVLVTVAMMFAAGPVGCFGQALGPNVLTNSSFELGFFEGINGAMALPNGSLNLAEWQVVGGINGGIQWLSSENICGFLPSDGLKFVNLVGTVAGADGAGIQLAAPLAVTPGDYYEFSFDLGTTSRDHWLYTDSNGLPGPGVQLTIDGSRGAPAGAYYFFGDTSLPDNDGNNRWTHETTGLIQATGYWLSISFSSIGYGGETLVGLDNLSLIPVPEPSGVALAWLGGGVSWSWIALARKGRGRKSGSGWLRSQAGSSLSGVPVEKP